MGMSNEEKVWKQDFERALTGNNTALRSIVKDETTFKVVILEIEQERRARKSDVLSKGYRIYGFIEGVDYKITEEAKPKKTTKSTKEWPMARGRYSPSDYQNNALATIEDLFIEAIDSGYFQKPKLSSVVSLDIGSKVLINMEDHYYNQNQGEVIDSRPNGQYLVRLDRKPPRRNMDGSGEIAQMWVTPVDVKILK